MAKIKYDPSKKDPNFKVSDIKEEKSAVAVATAMVLETVESQKKKENNCSNQEEME